MATHRPKGYGMSAELERKKAAKFDSDLAKEAMHWIKDGLGYGLIGLSGPAYDKLSDLSATIEPDVGTEDDVTNMLKDGVALCNLANIIQPGAVKKINVTKMAFKQMENIGSFLNWCGSYGCQNTDMFQTVDLYEGNNIPQVINSLCALGRKCQTHGWGGPKLGVRESTENAREFTEQQLRAGEAVIGLQAGSNKGASQAGQNFGKTRAIID